MRKTTILMSAIVAAGLFGSGCETWQNTSNQNKGVAIGAGTGAVAGGVIGKVAGNTGLGAIIGGAVGGVAGGIIGHKMDKQAEEIKNKVPDAKVERVGEGIVVEFNQAILFDFDKSTLNPAAYKPMNDLITILNTYPDTDIEVDGHTDSRGTEEYNQALSEKRANAVSSYLKSHGIASSRITTVGKGELYPKYSNDTPEGMAGNRRVEFQITANQKMVNDAQQEAKN